MFVSCSCRLFETEGFLCSHATKILREVLNSQEIPVQYILKSWTRNARTESVEGIHGRNIEVDCRLQQTSRYRSLCSIFRKLSSRAAESEETYSIAFAHAREHIE